MTPTEVLGAAVRRRTAQRTSLIFPCLVLAGIAHRLHSTRSTERKSKPRRHFEFCRLAPRKYLICFSRPAPAIRHTFSGSLRAYRPAPSALALCSNLFRQSCDRGLLLRPGPCFCRRLPLEFSFFQIKQHISCSVWLDFWTPTTGTNNTAAETRTFRSLCIITSILDNTKTTKRRSLPIIQRAAS